MGSYEKAFVKRLNSLMFKILGLPGIPPDVVALISLNLRAIGEYATYYGFNINSQEERLFVMNVLV
jgi:hypothetical protein